MPSSAEEAPALTTRDASRNALCLRIPGFELRLELLRNPGLDTTAAALLTPHSGGRPTLWQVSERAAASGVRPGMPISRALSLSPALTLLEPDPTHYHAAVEGILEALSHMSPIVEGGMEGTFFVGVDGLDRLLGPPADQVDAAFQELFRILPAPIVAETRAGWAPGTFGARVAAMASEPGKPVLVSPGTLPRFLATHPVSALPIPESSLQRLERLGIRTLGALARIPAEALVAQFGPRGRELRALAAGVRIDPVHARHRPRPIRVRLDLPSPLARHDMLHAALNHLVERALADPERRGRSIRGVRILGRLEGGGSWESEGILREAIGERESLAWFLRSRLALSPPPRGVESITLECFEFAPSCAQQECFDRHISTGRDEEGRGMELARNEVPEALRRAVRELKLRMGASPLYRVVEVDPWSRIPERRHALLGFDP